MDDCLGAILLPSGEYVCKSMCPMTHTHKCCINCARFTDPHNPGFCLDTKTYTCQFQKKMMENNMEITDA